MHMKNIKNKRLQRKNFKNMGDNVYAHHTNDLYQNDDISDSSDHETDTNSDSNLNNAPGTNYSDAIIKHLREMIVVYSAGELL